MTICYASFFYLFQVNSIWFTFKMTALFVSCVVKLMANSGFVDNKPTLITWNYNFYWIFQSKIRQRTNCSNYVWLLPYMNIHRAANLANAILLHCVMQFKNNIEPYFCSAKTWLVNYDNLFVVHRHLRQRKSSGISHQSILSYTA